MQVVHTLPALRAALAGAREIAFVPTMGNLHAGHVALVHEARRQVGAGAPVVSSVFVNRLQFLPHEDFDRYPRTLAADCAQLEAAGNDIVFAPAEDELYPEPQVFKVTPPAALSDILEGEFRPGFFTGVCTVVLKLLMCVMPTVAVFGRKDYQQWRVIEAMARQFALPARIVGAPTVRAEDGLALSSRNGYLGAAERAEAPALRQALAALAAAARPAATEHPAAARPAATEHPAAARPAGREPLPALPALEAEALQALRTRGWLPDYVTLRRAADLLPPSDDERRGGTPLVALGAARLGATRLIDNLEL